MSVGVAARCFDLPSRRSSHEVIRRSSRPPSVRDRVAEIIALLPIQKQNDFFPLKLNAPHGNGRNLQSSDFTYPDEYILQMSKAGEFVARQPTGDHFVDETVLHQQGIVERFHKSMLLTNLFMFILPHEALAETCEPVNSYMKMPLLFAVAMIGAAVGGFLARRRKDEMKRLNDQLRQINEVLRRQAKIESYAPGLSYAPTSRIQEKEVIVDPRKQQLLANLRTGKNFLRSQDPKKAFTEFKTAFELAQSLGDHLEEKKAARGLGASLQRQGKYREAIKYHSKVIEISQKMGDNSGSVEAYGAIADCYAELGDLERAGKFYDKYIARLEKD